MWLRHGDHDVSVSLAETPFPLRGGRATTTRSLSLPAIATTAMATLPCWVSKECY